MFTKMNQIIDEVRAEVVERDELIEETLQFYINNKLK